MPAGGGGVRSRCFQHSSAGKLRTVTDVAATTTSFCACPAAWHVQGVCLLLSPRRSGRMSLTHSPDWVLSAITASQVGRTGRSGCCLCGV